MNITCDKCEGSGKLITAVHTTVIPCYICDSTGKVHEDRYKWIEIGKCLKAERLKHRRTLFQESKLRWIGIIEYSNIEQGKLDNTQYIK